MTFADARAIVPALRTVAADPAGDARTLAGLARWCRRYTPWTAAGPGPAGAGAVRLDVTGCAHLFGGEAGLLADVTGRLAAAGFAVRAVIADTADAALAVARHSADPAPWSIVPAGGTRAALAPLPVAALGLAPDDAAGLAALGLGRIGDVLTLPRVALVRRFGARLAERLDAALGARAEPLSPTAPAAPHAARLAFSEPVVRTADLATALIHLAVELCAGLERAGRGARRLDLELVEPNGRSHRLAIGTSRPRRDAKGLARLFGDRLDAVEAPFGIETMALAAPLTEPLDPRQAALGRSRADTNTEGVAALVDRLGNKLGSANVIRFRACESYLPERAACAVGALDLAVEPDPPLAWPHQAPFAQARPLRLLAPPEPIEAIAPVPDDPPIAFHWRRVLRRVACAEGPERIAPEWWRADGAAADLRDYYRVEDAAGRRFWLYREGLYRPDARPAWYLHGVFG
jgi:protein ImuB